MSKNQKTAKTPTSSVNKKSFLVWGVVGTAIMVFVLAVMFILWSLFSFEITDRVFVVPVVNKWQKNQDSWGTYKIPETGMVVSAPAGWVTTNRDSDSNSDWYQVVDLRSNWDSGWDEGIIVGISLAKLTPEQAQVTDQENYYFNFNCGNEYEAFRDSGQLETNGWLDCHGEQHDLMYFQVKNGSVYSARYMNHYTFDHSNVAEKAAHKLLNSIRDSIRFE